MIFHYITRLEKEIIKEFAGSLRSLKALDKVKSLLLKVDHDTEEIPVTTSEKLIELLSTLKGQPLSIPEKKIASEIINAKKEKQ